MRAELAFHAANQAGLFTRGQARRAGYRGPEIRQRLGPTGDWVVVRRGVFAERALWDALDATRGRRLAIDRAAHLSLSCDHVLSHDSAARAWGLPLVGTRTDLVHITRPDVIGSRTEHGIKHHLARRLERPYAVEGLPVTDPARTALDLAREHGRLTGLVACDVAMRLGSTSADFAAVLATMRSWRHVTRARAAARAADPGAETPGETLARDLVVEIGAGRPITQYPVEIPHGVAWCDLLLGPLVIEFDGRRKYRSIEHGGDADRALEDVIWQEKVRERDIAAHGLAVTRVFWDDCWGGARLRSIARLRAEYEAACRRFGPDTPAEVTAFAEHMWPRRHRRLFRDRRTQQWAPRSA